MENRPYAETDLLVLLGEALAVGGSNAIEYQEARGQAKLATSDVLPIDCNRQERALFEQMGIVFHEPVDGLFVRVDLPEGWHKAPTHHAMWTDLVDNRGRKRAAIFYRAAFYDRSAHMNAVARLTYLTQPDGGYTDDYAAERLKPKECIVLDTATDGILWRVALPPEPPYNHATDGPEVRQSWLDYQDLRRGAEFHAECWLNQHFPDWRNPVAYWDAETLAGRDGGAMNTCPLCNNPYRLGYTGTVRGCDSCLGVTRDAEGYAWEPAETCHIYEDVATGKLTAVQRGDALPGEEPQL